MTQREAPETCRSTGPQISRSDSEKKNEAKLCTPSIHDSNDCIIRENGIEHARQVTPVTGHWPFPIKIAARSRLFAADKQVGLSADSKCLNRKKRKL